MPFLYRRQMNTFPTVIDFTVVPLFKNLAELALTHFFFRTETAGSFYLVPLSWLHPIFKFNQAYRFSDSKSCAGITLSGIFQ